MPKRKPIRKHRRRRRSQSTGNQLVRVMGDTAKLAIGAAVITSVTATAVSALKK